MATRKTKVEKVEGAEVETFAKAEYDLYALQKHYFEQQQKQVLEYWTSVLNNVFWWNKK